MNGFKRLPAVMLMRRGTGLDLATSIRAVDALVALLDQVEGDVSMLPLLVEGPNGSVRLGDVIKAGRAPRVVGVVHVVDVTITEV